MGQKTSKGLWMDSRPQEQPEGTYPFAKNGIQFETKGVVMNEPGFSGMVGLPGEPIGCIETDGAAVIFTWRKDNTGLLISEVGTYDRANNSYTKIKDDANFPTGGKWNFDRNFYITGEFQRNFLNQRVIAWTDKKNPPRMLNLDDVANVTTARQTKLFLEATAPTLDVQEESAGILDKGAYFVSVKYLKNDGSETGYLVTSKPIIISTDDDKTYTDKSLRITLTNLDQTFDKVQVAVVARVKGNYTAQLMQEVQITPGTLTLQYTGENLTEPATLEDILIPHPVYTKVGTMGQLNDALYIADLEKEPDLDLQRYANIVKVKVKSELIPATPVPEAHSKGQTRSLMHQEVYSLYIRYHRADTGSWTKAFHIPGNAPLPADLLASTSAHAQTLGAKVYQVEDTTRNLNATTKTCDTGIWVNANEFYPTTAGFDSTLLGGEDLRGKAVRHHRMPSIRFCKENFYPGGTGNNARYGKDMLDVLGLEISNVKLPSAYQSLIDGYEILIGKRSVANATVLGQSLMLIAAQANSSRGNPTNFVSTGGNWCAGAVNDRNNNMPVNFVESQNLIITGRNWNQITTQDAATDEPGLRVRLHSFDMLFNKPAITPAYMSAQLKLRRNKLNLEYPNGGYIEDGEIEEVGMPIMHIVDYTAGEVPQVVPASRAIRALEESKYLPNNVNDGTYENTMLEACYVAKMKWVGADSDVANNELPLNISHGTVNFEQVQSSIQRIPYEETYLVNLMDIKDNLYNSFYGQSLVASGQFIPMSSTASPTIYCGDTFINDYSYHTYGWFDEANRTMHDTTDPAKYSGYKIVRRYVCEAASNINKRYEVASNQYSKWWPKSPLFAQPGDASAYLYDFSRYEDPNQFGYNKDLNALNDFGDYTPYNPYNQDVSKFPFRIHRGGKMPRQGKARSWRTFLPLDYYEAQKNMGRIIRVLGKDDRLIIHHENAMFQTQDKAKLDGGNLSVTLGSGDIFQFEPQAALSTKQGYAGTQHELAAIDTPAGYIFADAKAGELFMFKNGLKMMNQGLNQFLRTHLQSLNGTNPFVGNGLTIGYDHRYKRILITLKNLTLTSNLANFVPDYRATAEFYAKLQAGTSVVYKDGMYQLFLGVNTTQYRMASAVLYFEPWNPSCSPKTCTSGFILSPDGTQCVKVETVAATPPTSGTPITTAARSFSSYSGYGTVVYDPGFAQDGTGSYRKIPTTNSWWINTPHNTIDGPLNRTGLWAVDADGNGQDDPLNTPIGFTLQITVPASKTYLIGIAGDNKAQIKVDGAMIVDQNAGAQAINFNTRENCANCYDTAVAFYFWHVYPVSLAAGTHTIELTGVNSSSVGAFGAEVYDATFEELSAMTSYTELGSRLIFSTKDVRGQQLQLGAGVAWSCPAGYALVQDQQGNYSCQKTTTTTPDSTYTKTYADVRIHETDINGDVVAIVPNDGAQTYNGEQVPYFAPEPNSPECGYTP